MKQTQTYVALISQTQEDERVSREYSGEYSGGIQGVTKSASRQWPHNWGFK